MEIYSNLANTNKLTTCLILLLAFFISACTYEEPFKKQSKGTSLVKNSNGTETVFLDNGEEIILQDTNTYIINYNLNQVEELLACESGSSRGVAPTGYDKKDEPKDYKKYQIGGLEKWGINPNNIYIAKYIYYYKNLPVNKGYYLSPTNSKYKENPVMGFNPPSQTLGFHTDIPDTWTGYETGITQVLYVNCDLSGISWNKNIPCNPSDFVWYYKVIEE